MTELCRQLERELDVTDALLTERNRVLDAIPRCEVHGAQCVPHAIEWIRAAQSASGPTREQVESLIKRIDDAMAFGMTGRDALPNLLRDCLAMLAAVGGNAK